MCPLGHVLVLLLAYCVSAYDEDVAHTMIDYAGTQSLDHIYHIAQIRTQRLSHILGHTMMQDTDVIVISHLHAL